MDLEDYLNKNFYDSGWMDLNNAVKYRKKNGFVTIRADGNGDNKVTIGNINNPTNIGTLPEGFRPSIRIIGIGTPKDATGYEVQFNIEDTGDILAMYLSSSKTSYYWSFTATYPVDD